MTRTTAPARVMLLGALLALAAPPGTAAQEGRERESCRCVDRDGNEIENCTCIRMPSPEDFVVRTFPVRARARMGVTLSMRQAGVSGADGVRIRSVLDGGPADEAGLREGDVITAVDGHPLNTPLDPEVEDDFDLDRSVPAQRLMAILRDLDPGDEVEVEYLRDGRRRTTTVELRDLRDEWEAEIEVVGPRWRDRLEDVMPRLRFRFEDHDEAAPFGRPGRFRAWRELREDRDRCPGDDEDAPVFSGWLDGCVGGVELAPMNPGLADYFGTGSGVLVTDVRDDSTLGLRPGDVILRIGDREATDPDRVRRILRSYGPDEEITFLIMRKQKEITVKGRLDG